CPSAPRPASRPAPSRGGGQVDRRQNVSSPTGGTAAMKRLAMAGRSAALSIGGYTSRGLCATGVSRAIQNAFGFKVWGNGNQIDNNLPRSRFKQVNMSLAEALKIPGLVLTWERTSTSLGRIYGHTAITAGDGRTSYSDFIETNTLAGSGGRSGLKIFMPI
ncbi:MAG: LysM domain-containing protein, partial [Myxococcales bacterium]